MYSIYFDNKVINFTQISAANLPDGYLIRSGEPIDVTKVLQKVEISKTITILSDNVDQIFGQFCSFFRVAQAAGGLVRDSAGRVLMIYRNGRWDLPKGHREGAESMEHCALREVEEECGVSTLQIGELICMTRHIYCLDGEWVLKECYWYAMSCANCGKLKPQTEEGIERVEWFDEAQVSEALKNTYKTIAEVFKNEKL